MAATPLRSSSSTRPDSTMSPAPPSAWPSPAWPRRARRSRRVKRESHRRRDELSALSSQPPERLLSFRGAQRPCHSDERSDEESAPSGGNHGSRFLATLGMTKTYFVMRVQ